MFIPFNVDYRDTYEKSHFEFIIPILHKLYQDKSDFETIIENIFSPVAYLLASELKKKDPNKKLIINLLNKLSNFKITSVLIDEALLITQVETRGECLELLRSTSEEKLLFTQILTDLKKSLPADWTDLISIIKTVTLVNIPGRQNQLNHFSGSDTNRWGALHMSRNLSPENIAECFTHEASHHWLNLYELYCSQEFIKDGWDSNLFTSPWRTDKRPLMGIYHGIYVFSNVYILLKYLESISKCDNVERIYRVGAQVKRGIEILENNLTKMSKDAKELFFQIKSKFLFTYDSTSKILRTNYYNAIIEEEVLKKTK